MKKKFNEETVSAKTPARLVDIPAHKAKGFNGMSMHEDGMQGKLANVSEAYIESQYGYEWDVPAQTIEFTSWDDLPLRMAKETRQLLKETMAREDEEFLQSRIVVLKPLSLKRA